MRAEYPGSALMFAPQASLSPRSTDATSVAVVTTAAAQLADPGIAPAAALTDGFRAAFGMTVVAAVLALVAALVLLPRAAAPGRGQP
jgi:predicted MFS family arabinose efflux permease